MDGISLKLSRYDLERLPRPCRKTRLTVGHLNTMNALQTRQQIQIILGVKPDGTIGHETLAALNILVGTQDDAPWPTVAQDGTIHNVIATSFADPRDVAAFRQCKAEGGTDEHCFSVGDNGIGFTGLDCSEGSGPACALPYEVWMQKWGSKEAAAGKPVLITNPANDKSVTALMKDTMPHLANITNGAGLDMSPDTCAALGLTPPVEAKMQWQWV